MKIYTKTGDKGETSLLGGKRVPKHHLRIETYGTVDELNSTIGMLRDLNKEESINLVLKEIQDRLFTIGSNLASDPDKSNKKVPDLQENDIVYLENEIDRMNGDLPELRSFILPGGDQLASWSHIARCICRRSERLTSQLTETGYVPDLVLKYLNRLSDYLFVLSRFFVHLSKSEEITWKPRI